MAEDDDIAGGGAADHPIGVVTRRTGLTQDLLRAWEKRYGAVAPRRGGNGRRLYGDVDVQRLRLLKELVDGGRRISDVARLPLARLQDLARQDARQARPDGAAAARRREAGQAARTRLRRCLDAIEDMDGSALDAALAAAALDLTPPVVRRDVVAPLLVEVGERWASGAWSIAHEHLAAAAVRACLWDMLRRAGSDPDGPVLVVATLAGERHELGALLAAAVAAERGWRVVYLGADLPAAEVAAAARRRQARAVLVSWTILGDHDGGVHEIGRLRQALPAATVVLAGGCAAAAQRAAVEAAGVRVAADLEALATLLRH